MERKQTLAYWIKVEAEAIKECKDNSFIFRLAEDMMRHSVELAQIVQEEEERKAA